MYMFFNYNYTMAGGIIYILMQMEHGNYHYIQQLKKNIQMKSMHKYINK